MSTSETALSPTTCTDDQQHPAPAVKVIGGIRTIEVAMEATQPAPANDPFGYTEYFAGVTIKRDEDSLMKVRFCTVATVVEGEEFVRHAEMEFSPGCLPVLAQVFSEAVRKLEARGFCSMVWP